MSKKDKHAIKVDHTEALMPQPSKSLLLEVAMGIHLSVAGSACISRDDEEEYFLEWNELTDETKMFWLEGAKCAYSIIAIHGGADVIQIEEPDA
tara:strand:+ start:9148 stop:9429 length:282 start_codon:yes stop_codon:yes gene_type:complete